MADPIIKLCNDTPRFGKQGITVNVLDKRRKPVRGIGLSPGESVEITVEESKSREIDKLVKSGRLRLVTIKPKKAAPAPPPPKPAPVIEPPKEEPDDDEGDSDTDDSGDDKPGGLKVKATGKKKK